VQFDGASLGVEMRRERGRGHYRSDGRVGQSMECAKRGRENECARVYMEVIADKRE
jgi:hypothetical protein